MPASPANKTGFWEPQSIVDMHDEVLRQAQTSWREPTRLPEAFWQQQAEPFVAGLADYLSTQLADSQSIVVKDPRLCRLVPLWRRVLDRLGVEPSFVLIVRHPLEVAASLQLHHPDLTPPRSHLLWLRHVLDSEWYSRGGARSLVSYAGLLDDWRAVIGRVTTDLGLDLRDAMTERASEIDAFLSPSRRHYTFSSGDLASDGEVFGWVDELYGAASTACAGAGAGDLDTKLFDRIHRELELADLAFLQQREDETHGRSGLEERGPMIEVLREREDDLARELTDARERLAERAEELELVREELKDLRGELTSTGRLLEQVLRSRSWRLTGPLRKLGALLRGSSN